MSNTIAHRPHVHHYRMPLLRVVAVLVTIAVAAAVIWAINRPETTPTSASQAVTAPLVAPMTTVRIDDRKGSHGVHGMTPASMFRPATATGQARDARSPHEPLPPGRRPAAP